MRWLVTGAAGMLGQAVVAQLTSHGEDVVGLGRSGLDVTDLAGVRRALIAHQPQVVVNCAAWTAVDEAESRESDAYAINARGPRNLALACVGAGARLLHVSTDYVFPGDANRPYDEAATTGPRTAYGRTKLAGERAVLETLPNRSAVVRTAWLYGAGGPNFVATMIRLERERDTIEVVADQRGQPTWTVDVADRLVALGNDPVATGVFHATSSGAATWYDLAQEVFRLLGADPDRVRPTTSAAYPRPAHRPAYSVLGHRRWQECGFVPLGDWRERLTKAFPAMPAVRP